MASFHRVQTENWLKTIKVKANKVLDVGGSQLPIKGRTKSWDVKEYRILDLEVPHECKQKPDIIGDINKPFRNWYSKDNILYDEYDGFDVIFCIEVFEYVWNTYQVMLNLYGFLKKNGVLYLTFPFVYGCHKPEGTDFLRYTPAGVEKLLGEVGFKVLEHKYRVTNIGKLFDFYRNERMKLLSNFNHEIIGSMVKCQKI